LLVLGVVLLGQGAVHGHQLRGTNLQAAVLEAGQDLAGELPPDRIRLDQNERLLPSHYAAIAELRDQCSVGSGGEHRRVACRLPKRQQSTQRADVLCASWARATAFAPAAAAPSPRPASRRRDTPARGPRAAPC